MLADLIELLEEDTSDLRKKPAHGPAKPGIAALMIWFCRLMPSSMGKPARFSLAKPSPPSMLTLPLCALTFP